VENNTRLTPGSVLARRAYASPSKHASAGTLYQRLHISYIRPRMENHGDSFGISHLHRLVGRNTSEGVRYCQTQTRFSTFSG